MLVLHPKKKEHVLVLHLTPSQYTDSPTYTLLFHTMLGLVSFLALVLNMTEFTISTPIISQ